MTVGLHQVVNCELQAFKMNYLNLHCIGSAPLLYLISIACSLDLLPSNACKFSKKRAWDCKILLQKAVTVKEVIPKPIHSIDDEQKTLCYSSSRYLHVFCSTLAEYIDFKERNIFIVCNFLIINLSLFF